MDSRRMCIRCPGLDCQANAERPLLENKHGQLVMISDCTSYKSGDFARLSFPWVDDVLGAVAAGLDEVAAEKAEQQANREAKAAEKAAKAAEKAAKKK